MVATKLSEVATKGIEWAYSGSGSNTNVQNTGSNSNYYNSMTSYASDYANYAYSTFSGYLSSSASTIADAANTSLPSFPIDSSYLTVTDYLASMVYNASNSAGSVIQRFPSLNSVSDRDKEEQAVIWSTPRRPTLQRSSADIAWMFMNPFNSVRGRHQNPSSLGAIRSLLINMEHPVNQLKFSEVDLTDNNLIDDDSYHTPQKPIKNSLFVVGQDESEEEEEEEEEEDGEHPDTAEFDAHPLPSTCSSETEGKRQQRIVSKHCEMASQLAEGTIRALRDISLDEAVELHQALRYWSVRWENPMLSWLEAGPAVWLSSHGYNHKSIGQKVSEIQAVLARRCALIGDLQQHLLRAGWQRGVAQWGVLGQGGQWAAIETVHEKAEEASEMPDIHGTSSSGFDNATPMRRSYTIIGESDTPDPSSVLPHSGYYANVFVKNQCGGEICLDDAALAEWSVDAMILIRNQLIRAASGHISLPCEENWQDGEQFQRHQSEDIGQLIVPDANSDLQTHRKLPIWARLATPAPGNELVRDELVISDVRLMATEVSELLNAMETIIENERSRLLQRMKPPTALREKWYMVAFASPIILYLARDIFKNGYRYQAMLKVIVTRITNFFRDHVRDPLLAIIKEVWKGREPLSDKKARLEAISILKSMIRSWLDETYPDLPISERNHIAETMDISLIEQKKAESMKTFYEINSVVRMSFIEMQFIKKEMMNAMYAMDEMMAANDINMNLAAITPAAILLYLAQQSFKFLFYALLKLGKSREEIFANFRHTLTEVERLLVMRNSPPTYFSNDINNSQIESRAASVLRADDLGMLMLHVHECRTILWNDRRRFTPNMIRSVSEDLAELAGERGAVSVPQQLQIIERMNRTYPFLKVLGMPSRFHFRNAI